MTVDIKKHEMLAQVIGNRMTMEGLHVYILKIIRENLR